MAETRSGIPLEPVYGEAQVAEARATEPGLPGEPPFTRGITRRMYLERPWIMGQYAGFGSAEQTNGRFKELLRQGQTGFSVALDLPTQLGLDSDHPHARGEVGRVGVAIDSLADMELLFDGIPLESIRQIRTTANSIGHLWLALNVAFAEKKGHDPNAVKILIQNDVLKEYIARGTQIYPPRAGLRIAADVIEYCARRLPSWTPLSMSGYHMREAGASAVQELAFTFANGIAYCEAAVERGLSVDDFAPSLFTFLTADMELLEEVAKFRAARKVWDDIMGNQFHAKNPDSRALRIFAFSAGSNLTAQQPLVNVVRVTINALAAVLGGVQTLHTSAYDEALGVPTEEAATLALRTQQVILEETGLTKVVDPLGGSYAIETLTAEIERRVRAALDEIAELGGALACIESGWFKGRIAESAYRIQTQIDSGDRRVIGVNCFVVEEGEHGPDPFVIDASIEAEQVDRLRRLRESRDSAAVRKSLQRVEAVARDGGSIIEPTIEAVRAYATVGEISEALRTVLGSYQPDAVI
ncbi:MAG TPA: methylmalonyl-CoA mutase family protein [Candidatus Dormibacteraeota bacterium]|nr:methylmalonyl-CoA mutase family protein [Candidatus Dormibacteraeota bacterium]